MAEGTEAPLGARLRVWILPLLVFTWLQCQAAQAAPDYDQALVAETLASGLAFIAPRALEETSVRQLAEWGLEGFAILDPTLSARLREGQVVLLQGGRQLAAEVAPRGDDAAAWGEMVAWIGQLAGEASPAVRRAGSGGIIASFFAEVFNRLDPYSRYVPPPPPSEAATPAAEGGIGVELGGRPGAVSVARLKADGPAAQAGVEVGERILAVDGVSTAGQGVATIGTWLAGPEGTELRITLAHPGRRPRVVTVMRQLVPPETVFPERRGALLVLHITGFVRDTDTRLEAELARHLEEGQKPPEGLILDLRGNRGGLLRQAVLAADALIAGGVVAVTAGRDPEASMVWQARPDDLAGGLPAVVLTDGRTASAAEILAAALQDHGRAVLVGSTTLGKGLVQAVGQLPDGGQIYVSWSRVLAPAGYPIQALGVMPQICTSLGPEITERQMRALAAGQLELRPALLRHDAMRAPLAMNTVLDLRAACPSAEPTGPADPDMQVAQRLLANPALYGAALLTPALAPY